MTSELRCKRCGAPLPMENVHTDLGLAKCGHCHAVMDLLSREEPAAPAAAPAPSHRRRAGRAAVPLPEKFKVEDQGSSLAIEWRWFSPVFIFLIVFCVFWDGFLVVWYSIAVASKTYFMGVFALGHVAVGVGLSWYTLAGLINRTRLEVAQGTLRIRHFPLFWPGQRTLPVDRISQFFVQQRVHRNKGSVSYTYDLNAVLRPDGRSLKLLGRLESAEQGLFLEQRLESFLGITDEPVEGELSKKR